VLNSHVLDKLFTWEGNSKMDLQYGGGLGWIDLAQDKCKPEVDADHSPPPSVEVENEWSFISSPPPCLHST